MVRQAVHMLTHPPTAEERALLTVARVVNRLAWDWDRELHRVCVGFHALVAFTLAAAPDTQLYSAGTRPVFDVASRYVWAAAFLIVAVALHRIRNPRIPLIPAAATWLAVWGIGGMWATAMVLALSRDEGNALALIFVAIVYGIFAVVGCRNLGKR